jgi:multidrug resistance efflux pump
LALPWHQRATVAELQLERDIQRGGLQADQSRLAWLEAELAKTWFGSRQLEAEIASTRRLIELRQAQIRLIDAETNRRASGPTPP